MKAKTDMKTQQTSRNDRQANPNDWQATDSHGQPLPTPNKAQHSPLPEQDRKRELAGLGLKVGATFIPSLDGFAISENDLANVIKERDEARNHADKLAQAMSRMIQEPNSYTARQAAIAALSAYEAAQ